MMQVAVIGAGKEIDNHFHDMAYLLGSKLAHNGHILICGGKGGIMETASKGAHDNNGIVIGILPENKRLGGNEFLSAEIITGMGEMRNAIVVASGDVFVAFPGSFGTLSEISFALKNDKRIIIVGKENFPLNFDDIKSKNLRFASSFEDIGLILSEYDDL